MIEPIGTVPSFEDPLDGADPTSPGTDTYEESPGYTEPEPVGPEPECYNPEWTDGTPPDVTVLDWAMLPEGASVATVDFDLDGLPDRILVDTNGDGMPDIVVEKVDGGFIEYYDGDFDGGFETVVEFTDAEMWEMDPDLYTYMTGDETGPDPDPGTDGGTNNPTVVDGEIIGDPFAYGDDWFYQTFNGSCLPASVAQIFSEYTGESVSDLDFVHLANELGLWAVGPDGVPGMYPEDAATLLESVGIPATYQSGQDLNDLVEYLSPPPHAVMVAVDADVFWYGESADQINHAVLITGIDPENGIVYISDTGTPDGNMMEVSLDDFLEAWDVGDNQLVVADVSAEEFRAQNGTGYDDTETGADPEPGDIGATAGDVSTWVSDNKWVLLPVTISADSVRN